jgi:O-antigen ligase
VEYVPGNGDANYLMPYFPWEKVMGNLSRFSFFFQSPEPFALYAGLVGLLALDIKNRLWSVLLFIASVFLLFVSGTRSTWISFPIVLIVRYWFAAGSAFGPSFLCGLAATACFVTLSIYPVTDLIEHKFTNTTTAVSEFREDSTETRTKIYQETLKAIPEKFLTGHVVEGPTVDPGFEPAKIGSHSFWLGSLMYQGGLVSLVLFLNYWVSFIMWLYNTRIGRPMMCLLGMLFFSLTFAVMPIPSTGAMGILMFAALREPTTKSPSKNFAGVLPHLGSQNLYLKKP